MTTTTASDKTFGRDVLGASVPVLVEFSAADSPSNAALNELSTDMATKLKVVKVDVGCYPNLKDEYGVRGLPALVLFKHGKPVARMVGSRHSKTELEEWINGALILALATRRTAAGRAAAEFKLANGMQIIVIPDDRVPAVTHLVWYKVGSAHEPRDFQGLARFVGHLSFKSLNKIANGDHATGWEHERQIFPLRECILAAPRQCGHRNDDAHGGRAHARLASQRRGGGDRAPSLVGASELERRSSS